MRQGVKTRDSGKGEDSTNIPRRHSINSSSTPHGTCNQLVVSLYHEMKKVRSPYPIRVVDQTSNLVVARVLGTYIWWYVQSITADGQQGLWTIDRQRNIIAPFVFYNRPITQYKPLQHRSAITKRLTSTGSTARPLFYSRTLIRSS